MRDFRGDALRRNEQWTVLVSRCMQSNSQLPNNSIAVQPDFKNLNQVRGDCFDEWDKFGTNPFFKLENGPLPEGVVGAKKQNANVSMRVLVTALQNKRSPF